MKRKPIVVEVSAPGLHFRRIVTWELAAEVIDKVNKAVSCIGVAHLEDE